MKIQVKRITRSEPYNAHPIDTQFLEGTVDRIRPGIKLKIKFAMEPGEWRTTQVTSVEYVGDKKMFIHTKNSVYLIFKGWRENEEI